MIRSEALQSAKPILFNTEMVRTIQNGTKTATRRIIKSRKDDLNKCRFVQMSTDPSETRIARNGEMYPHDLKGLYATFEDFDGGYFPLVKAPYQVGDILYVRETWSPVNVRPKRYLYRTHCPEAEGLPVKWYPSIHMPKEAARIFLRITGVRVERLQDMKLEDFLQEGIGTRKGLFVPSSHFIASKQEAYWYAKDRFEELWDSSIKKSDIEKYGWDTNPWVWVIEFERLEVMG